MLLLGEWEKKEDVQYSFNLSKEYFDSVNIIYACYDIDGYEGSAFVLFEQNGKVYEVNAAHCSCYGLEEGWDFEDTSYEALQYRMEKGNLKNAFGGYYEQVMIEIEKFK